MPRVACGFSEFGARRSLRRCAESFGRHDAPCGSGWASSRASRHLGSLPRFSGPFSPPSLRLRLSWRSTVTVAGWRRGEALPRLPRAAHLQGLPAQRLPTAEGCSEGCLDPHWPAVRAAHGCRQPLHGALTPSLWSGNPPSYGPFPITLALRFSRHRMNAAKPIARPGCPRGLWGLSGTFRDFLRIREPQNFATKLPSQRPILRVRHLQPPARGLVHGRKPYGGGHPPLRRFAADSRRGSFEPGATEPKHNPRASKPSPAGVVILAQKARG